MYTKRKLQLKKTLFVLPLLLIDLPIWQILLGFAIMHIICSLVSAFIFQLAHVLEETHFYKTDDNGSVENNWAIHQLKTTANFSEGSSFFSWFIGGLNYQVEHHLFPNICHIHYPAITKIIKNTSQEYDVVYKEQSIGNAIKSHFRYLKRLAHP